MQDAASWFSEEELPGLRDFWRVYESGLGDVSERSQAAFATHPVLGPMMAQMTPEQRAAEQARSTALLRNAVAGDWASYEANLRGQGTMFATLGIEYSTWSDVLRLFARLVTPRLVAQFGAEPARLTGALLAMQRFLDRGMGILTEQYLATKERLIEQQKGLADRRAAQLATSEEALRRQTTILSSVLENVRDGVSVADDSGTIILFNKAARDICGLDALGMKLTALVEALPSVRVAPNRQGDDGPLMERALRGEASDDVESWFERKDGTRVQCSTYVRPLPGPDGKPHGAMSIFRDITDRTRLQTERARSTELESQNRQIQEANRLKSEFLANMSHELRTPLNAIIGFTELIHDGEVRPEMPQYKEFLGDILASGRHLLQLINDVLDLSKVEAGKLEFHPEELDLARVIQEILAILRATAAQKSIRTEADIDPSLGPVFVDAARLKQVLYNYISNALKFTPRGGHIIVRARAVDGRSFRIDVEDNGIGIAEADVGKLFVEFQQLSSGTAKQHGGTGLGLALTRRLVEAQGGSVGVTSTYGRGSTFHAVLPRRADGGTAVPQMRSFAGASANAPSVLVVEDNAQDQATLVRTLTNAGYAVETAATGAQALARCAQKTFDAITLDLLLPDASGLDLLRAIRAEGHNARVPVVVITLVAERGSLAGFVVHDILPKPLDGGLLLDSLRRAGVQPGNGEVLVIDDDAGSQRLMTAALGQIGFERVRALDAIEGLRSAARQPPVAVVLDLVMPGMTGFEFLDHFRAVPGCERVPVIIWSVKDLSVDEREHLRRSAQAVVTKGQDPNARVLDVLRSVLGDRRQ